MYSSPLASPSNVKGELQMLIQSLGLPLPTYTTLPQKGPSHDPTFTVKLQVWGAHQKELWAGLASGKTKKEAEVNVARQALDNMQDNQKIELMVEKVMVCAR